ASADNTAELARKLGISVYVHPQNLGYGGNQKTCYSKALESGADIVVLLHPDYQYDPKAVPLLIAPILAGEADMTFGSRFAGLGDPRGGGMPRYRYWGNRITTAVENLALGTHFSEMHSGLRAYTRDCLLSLPFLEYSNDFTFDAHFLVDAVVTGRRIVEVPIPTRYTKESSSISVLRSLKYVWQSMRYAWRQGRRWGRRGKRSPLTIPKRRPLSPAPTDVERTLETCALCGSNELEMHYPSNAQGLALPAEFACTSDALATHDDIVRCRRCGMVSSVPPADEAAIVDNYQEMSDELYLEEQQARTDLFDWVLDRMEGFWSPGRTLVEVGSNVGLFLKVAGDRGWKASGIEPSRWAVRTGRERFGVDLAQGTLRDLHPNDPVDAVVMLDVLEHLYDPLKDLRQVRDLMHDDGLLTLSTIN
ncbi:MAG: bifunctional glycosyltransferase/class I SAM-dependent methyltransferase, partial [Actinobacteria bacterium]|nr:bifunctional glycosyltransferase/class I SAM-dependent methyltransferase [Actinomycetota bacterium]